MMFLVLRRYIRRAANALTLSGCNSETESAAVGNSGTITVGKLEELGHPIQRYLLPLQSIEQVIWVVLCVTVSCRLCLPWTLYPLKKNPWPCVTYARLS